MTPKEEREQLEREESAARECAERWHANTQEMESLPELMARLTGRGPCDGRERYRTVAGTDLERISKAVAAMDEFIRTLARRRPDEYGAVEAFPDVAVNLLARIDKDEL